MLLCGYSHWQGREKHKFKLKREREMQLGGGEGICEFCGQEGCTLMKAEVIKHGAIIESNVEGPMRAATERIPATYCFKGIPAY